MEAPDPFPPAFRFVLAGLATWRLAFLVVREAGPAGVLERIRAIAEAGPLKGLLGCVKCAGFWIALPMAWFVGGGFAEFLVTWLALAGVVALIDEWLKPPFEWREEAGDGVLRGDRDEIAEQEPSGEAPL